MRNVTLTLCAACAFALGHLAVSAAEGPWDSAKSEAVCTEAHDQLRPAVGFDEELGVIVLWEDKRPDGKKEGTKQDSSVYGKTLGDGKEFVVFCPKDANAADPAISGRQAVYQHNRGWTNVVLQGLPGTSTKTLAGIAYSPAIDGDLVVFASATHRWEGWTGKGNPRTSWISDILAYELAGIGETFDIVKSEGANQQNPDVSGTTVVWQEGRAAGGWNNTGIYKRDIDSDPEPVRVCKKPGKTARNPRISGSIVVWEDNRNGNWDIYAWDIEAEAEIEICTEAGDQQNPTVDGGIVVWQDNRGGDFDLYGYDIETKETFPVYKGKGDQTEPDLLGDVVVWTDSRSGSGDIYMSRKTTQ